MSLAKYTGPWTYEKAAHLLRRATFGPDFSIVSQAVTDGLDTTIEQLFEVQPLPDPPVNVNPILDLITPVGETWINKPYTQQSQDGREFSLAGWTVGQMTSNRMSIIEKLVIFWHNHFAIGVINPDARYLYRYINTIRENALGNFKQLTKDITIDPMMLRYLNGNQNKAQAPNENYARELLELFTVGKGNIVGAGDYETFTEVDVIEVAKVLTGWKDKGYKKMDTPVIEVIFRNGKHDKTTKTLSHRFGNVQIEDAGDQEYAQLIDIIFESPHAALFICRKLYRWFVFYDITEEVETTIIEPMAEMLRESDYDILPVLKTLLLSEHFYEDERAGCMIKNPLDYVLSITNGYGTKMPEELATNYFANALIFEFVSESQMSIYNLPSVAGWKAYYQSPGYYQIWINSVTLPLRHAASRGLSESKDVLIPQVNLTIPIGIDAIAVLDDTSDPYDVNKVVSEVTKIHLPRALADDQYLLLKESLLGGLPDFEWSVEYGQYVADPDNEELRLGIDKKMRSLIDTMMKMPEFQLM